MHLERIRNTLAVTAFCLLAAPAFSRGQLSETATLPPEYLVFEIPELPLVGPHRHSWFVLRPPMLWTPTGLIDFSQVEWPKWDKGQVPPFLLASSQSAWQTEVVILDGAGREVERVSLKKPWSPLAGRQAGQRFRVEMFNERVRIISKSYPWPQTQELFRCNIKLGEQTEADSSGEGKRESPLIEQNHRVQVCLDSLRGVAQTATSDKQWFVEIHWPKKTTRRGRRFISEVERALKPGLLKNKHVLITHLDTNNELSARAGLTNNEKLPEIGIDLSRLPAQTWHGPAAARSEKTEVSGAFETSDGGRVILHAFAKDAIVDHSINSPEGLKPSVNIQFVKASTPKVRRTDFREERTGFAGFLRPWFVSASANYHILASGRGETVSSLNLPSIEAAWRSPFFGLEPFATLDMSLLHYNTEIALQEGHAGLKWRWRPEIAPFVGIFNYNLRGRNPGSTRLGSLQAFSTGVYTVVRRESFFVRGHATLIVTDPFSYDAYVEGSRFLKTLSDKGLFVGAFLGYTVYSGKATSVLRTTETFSENRFKFGLTIGLAGPDYF